MRKELRRFYAEQYVSPMSAPIAVCSEPIDIVLRNPRSCFFGKHRLRPDFPILYSE